MTRALVAHIIAACAAFVGLWCLVTSGSADSTIADAAPGVALAALAIAAGLTPRFRAVGVVAAIGGGLWFAGEWDALQWLHRGAIAWLVLAYPGAVLRRWPVVAVVAAVFIGAAVPALVADPAVSVILAGAVAIAAVVRTVRSPRIVRRSLLAALAAATVLAATWTSSVVLVAVGAPAELGLAVYLVGTAYVAVILLIDVTFGRSPESEFVGVVIDLGGVTDTGTLRDRLARIVGDPDLWLGYRLADGRHVDDAGLPAPWGAAPAGRVVTPIEDDGRRVAVLVHDRAIRVDPALLPRIAAATSMALRNVQLHADVRAHAMEVERSRDRLLEAEKEARRGFEDDLEAGPQRRLDRVATLLADIEAGDGDRPLAHAVARARDELRKFGRGLHPTALADDDLAASLLSAAAAFPFRLEVNAQKSPRSSQVSAAVWFICTEAITNAAKHALPQLVTVAVEVDLQDAVIVTVRDDGCGGASVDAGTGLRGIRERAEALHGGLEVHSPPGAGTTVRAWFPAVTPVAATSPIVDVVPTVGVG